MKNIFKKIPVWLKWGMGFYVGYLISVAIFASPQLACSYDCGIFAFIPLLLPWVIADTFFPFVLKMDVLDNMWFALFLSGWVYFVLGILSEFLTRRFKGVPRVLAVSSVLLCILVLLGLYYSLGFE
jgi:hypothetical protein